MPENYATVVDLSFPAAAVAPATVRSHPPRFLVEIWDDLAQAWQPTSWTRGGLPACEVTAQVRLEEARREHPEVRYRLRRV